MQYHVCPLSVAPIRKEASDKSEIITQVLFGEMLEETAREKQWVQVKCTWDGYSGWIDEKQLKPVTNKYFEKYKHHDPYVSLDVSQPVLKDDKGFSILMGSTLPLFDGLTLDLEKDKFIYNGLALNTGKINDPSALIEKFALKYLHAPYLWGGRSPFGIDCSGYTQIVFKMLGIPLKRDAYLQIDQGQTVDFIEVSKPGDLAFFGNDEGKITHVGIVLKNNTIAHASGFVRIDKLDNHGIYNTSLKKYTHKLKLVKRLF